MSRYDINIRPVGIVAPARTGGLPGETPLGNRISPQAWQDLNRAVSHLDPAMTINVTDRLAAPASQTGSAMAPRAGRHDDGTRQTLTSDTKINGITYPAGTRIEDDYQIQVTDGDSVYRMVGLSIDETLVGFMWEGEAPAGDTYRIVAGSVTPPPSSGGASAPSVPGDPTGIAENRMASADPSFDRVDGPAYLRDHSGPDTAGKVKTPPGEIVENFTFSEIENIICFAAGTSIATYEGAVAVEDLRLGDRVLTRDNGFQKIRWVGHRPLKPQELAERPNLVPILVPRGAYGNDLPERDLTISPNHRLLIHGPQADLLFGETEVLVAAKHLVDGGRFRRAPSRAVTYVHFMFECHEVVLGNGIWSESFQPGDFSLKGLGLEQRREIFALFPELATQKGVADFTAARTSLRHYEAQVLRTSLARTKKI
ncbi:Hint domain-containing protein [Pseudooceanicola algae]|uniref:Hedgehog/Intein (Hint) domain-containing protein n=1 Tax=Pseudooceanicola algae TaxID=1537215 RepID=A0A418SGX5_9RHOB|nr:Hint domain-containing protein [Pseudooceanicola algae]QPM90306.1 hypothetical protein PSAL_015410 [Pseudooceanicola algae]